MDVIQKLDQLAEFMSQRDLVGVHKQEAVDAVLTPEIKAKLADIETEFAAQSVAVNENIDALTAEIKNAVIGSGATAKGAYIQAVYQGGRETVDMKLFKGYAVAHPEVMRFFKICEPFVTIRKIG